MRCSFSTRQVRTGKMQRLTFTGCVDLHITYFERSVLASSINFMYVRDFLRKYGLAYVEKRLYLCFLSVRNHYCMSDACTEATPLEAS
jgi:hypothetical protein